MRRLMATAGVMLLVVGGLAVTACGGGGSGGGDSKKETDPGKVATATPAANIVLYQIQGDQVTSSGGTTAKTTPVAGTASTGSTYTVVAGDLCGSIASKFGISVDDLQKANRAMDCGALQIGQTLKIPAKTASPTAAIGGLTSNPTTKPSGKSYTVKSGDTCSDIAGSYGVSTADLIAKNGLDPNCTNLKIGQTLTIP